MGFVPEFIFIIEPMLVECVCHFFLDHGLFLSEIGKCPSLDSKARFGDLVDGYVVLDVRAGGLDQELLVVVDGTVSGPCC